MTTGYTLLSWLAWPIRCENFHQRDAWSRTANRPARICRICNLRHKNIPGLPRLTAGVGTQVRATPHSVGAASAARSDPWKNVDGIAGNRRSVAHLDRSTPVRPAAGGRRCAYEDLPQSRAAAAQADSPSNEEVSGSVEGQHREESIRRSGQIVRDVNEVCIVRPVPCRYRGIQEVKVSHRVGRSDVQ